MDHQFKKHYTRDEARKLLPQIELWLDQIASLRADLLSQDASLAQGLAAGDDLGGPSVNAHLRTLASVRHILLEFQTRQIQIKDLDRGLVDFPAFVGGREVFLCWERGEEDIEFWHDLDSGYSSRERL